MRIQRIKGEETVSRQTDQSSDVNYYDRLGYPSNLHCLKLKAPLILFESRLFWEMKAS